MKPAAIILLLLGLATMVHTAAGQATLPTSYTGPWYLAFPPDGWTFSGLGGPDYIPGYDPAQDGAAKFTSTNSAITIHFAQPPAALSYWICGNMYTGGIFRVEQSVDGTAWTTLQDYTALPNASNHVTHAVDPTARYIRFHYLDKFTGNVGVDGIAITRLESLIPRFSRFVYENGTITAHLDVSFAECGYVLESTPGLTTNTLDWYFEDERYGTDGPLVMPANPYHSGPTRFYRVRQVCP